MCPTAMQNVASKKAIYDIGTEILNFQCFCIMEIHIFSMFFQHGYTYILQIQDLGEDRLHFSSSFFWQYKNTILSHLGIFFGSQYFDCLPPKYDTWCRHSIRKMISASRRIFWHSFQQSILKTLLSQNFM